MFGKGCVTNLLVVIWSLIKVDATLPSIVIDDTDIKTKRMGFFKAFKVISVARDITGIKTYTKIKPR